MTTRGSRDRLADAPTQLLPVYSDRTGPRAAWADTAKGVCILLVVLWHVIMKHYLQIDWRLGVPLPGAWGRFGELLLPLRMPLFFTVSGMFAVAAARRPWKAVRRGRVAKFYYLYAIWFAVHTTVLAFVPRFDTLAAHSALEVLEQVTITPTNLWYLIALALYFVVGKLTWRLPAPVVLGAALVLSVTASAGLLAGPGNRGQLYQNLFFFLAGLRLKPWVERLATEKTLRTLLIAGTGYLAVMAVVELFGARQWFGVWPLASMFAVVVGVTAAVQLQRLRRPAALLAGLGRQTLPIYVMHMPLLALLHLLVLRPFSSAGASVQLLLAVVLPVALTAMLVWSCLALHRGLHAVGASWLFDFPRFRRPRGDAGGNRSRPAPDWAEAPTRVLPAFRR
jgi:uncharacterized membrane protein YcfT